jgi:hypothetical protein
MAWCKSRARAQRVRGGTSREKPPDRRLVDSPQNKLGGGEGIEGVYGSITQQGMQKVIDCLRRNTGLDHRSTFVDIGAGLGR